uniref:Uncharacterized protein n=1 Tax=uncultured prokaryote TaxID=198431 RepID=A0A0H5QLD7_9ZZZZ|nr:hypothetical protein [uncultured prokaryote]
MKGSDRRDAARPYRCRDKAMSERNELGPTRVDVLPRNRISHRPSEQGWVLHGVCVLLQEVVEMGGFAIELKAHRRIVPSPSAVQTKCGTCPGATPEGGADV